MWQSDKVLSSRGSSGNQDQGYTCPLMPARAYKVYKVKYLFNAQGNHMKKKRNNKGKKPGNGDQSCTPPSTRLQQEKERAPPFQLPPKGPLCLGTDPQKTNIQDPAKQVLIPATRSTRLVVHTEKTRNSCKNCMCAEDQHRTKTSGPAQQEQLA